MSTFSLTRLLGIMLDRIMMKPRRMKTMPRWKVVTMDSDLVGGGLTLTISSYYIPSELSLFKTHGWVLLTFWTYDLVLKWPLWMTTSIVPVLATLCLLVQMMDPCEEAFDTCDEEAWLEWPVLPALAALSRRILLSLFQRCKRGLLCLGISALELQVMNGKVD